MKPKTLLMLAVAAVVCLVPAASAQVLEITPEEGFESSGEPGGPFTPVSIDYLLTNIGPNTIYWGVDNTADWVDVYPEWGPLDPNESITVTATINSLADSLPEGVFTDELSFLDITNLEEQIRPVTLTVALPGGIWIDPEAFSVTVLEGRTLTEILTLANDGVNDVNFVVRTRVVADLMDSAEAQETAAPAVPEDRDLTVAANAPYKPDELIVRFAPKAKGKQFSNAEKQHILTSLGGGSIKRNFKLVPGLTTVKLPPGMTVQKALRGFNKAKGILYAQPNYRLEATDLFPDDPRFNELWGMHNTGQTDGFEDADIDAPQAWAITTDAPEIVVAVLDTGVDYTHPDLKDNIWVNEAELNGIAGEDDDGNGYIDDIHGYDFVNSDGDPIDDHYHGTHVAGTIGAVGNNREGVAGICWNVRIMALKFLDSEGGGWTEDAIVSLQYSVRMGANLTNNSYGGGGYNQAFKDAIDAAGAAGQVFVAAAGNENDDTDITPHYPSSYDCESIISVMATDKYDYMSSFSNSGLVSVDLGAPGSSILSTFPTYFTTAMVLKGYLPHYYTIGGTSMASPHVAGACALVMAYNPALTNIEVKNVLMRSVDNTLSWLCASGGRLNLHRALLEAKAPWIIIEPQAGTVGPPDSNELNVTFNAIGMSPGTYEAEILVNSSDPYNPTTVIPVAMTVIADDLAVTPVDDFQSAGTVGGPFGPGCMTYTLTNIGLEAVSWSATDSPDWLTVDPNAGTLDPNQSLEVDLCVSNSADLLEPNIYTHILTFTNNDSNSIKLRSVSLTIYPPDSFAELFDDMGTDLEFLSITFSPDGSSAYYESCRDRAEEFPTDPNGGTYLALGDDDFAELVPTGARTVLFHGQRYDRMYVSSNGYITFGQGDIEYAPTLDNHFNLPRISAFLADLVPPDSQCISYKQLEDRIAVTFENVALYGDKDSMNSFQMEMFFVDGTIRITWLELTPTPTVVGISDGNGLPAVFFAASDLSRYPACWPAGDFSRDYFVNGTDFAILADYWQQNNCDVPHWCARLDVDRSGQVDIGDVKWLAEAWLTGEDWSLQPVAQWKFDEGAGVIAYDSAGSHDGDLLGEPNWVTGQVGTYALEFDGIDDYVETDSSYSILGGDVSFTVAAWFNTLATYSTSSLNLGARLITIYNNLEPGPFSKVGLGFYGDGTDTLMCYYNSTIGIGTVLESESDFNDGQWHHLAASYDANSDELTLYYDGAAAGSEDAGRIDYAGTRPARIGLFDPDGNRGAFNGLIDEVRVYDRTLSPEEILQLYLSDDD
ncbi:MAG: S8 family serine peptidase [Planctomycetota bacterium]